MKRSRALEASSATDVGSVRRRRAATARGFTLVELLACVMIIALLAAMATPSFIAMMRDRRVARAGQIIADTYREGRGESLRRGIAVLVRWRGNGTGKGTIEIKEVVVQAAGAGLPGTCTTANFADGALDTRSVSLFDFAKPQYELAEIKMFNEASQETQFADVCFAPDGRTFKRYAEADPMDALTGVPTFKVKNTLTTANRTVFVPPNGVARMQL